MNRYKITKAHHEDTLCGIIIPGQGLGFPNKEQCQRNFLNLWQELQSDPQEGGEALRIALRFSTLEWGCDKTIKLFLEKLTPEKLAIAWYLYKTGVLVEIV